MLFSSRIFWLARMAWGLYVTQSVLTGGSLLASFGPMDRFSAWTFIAVLGWSPMLLPPSASKFAKLAWGWAASIYLPNVLNAIHMSTGFLWPKPLYWPLALLVAWGPAVIPWLLEARRGWSFATGASATRDKAGHGADWSFESDDLKIGVDLNGRALRLRARHARWRLEGGEWNVGPVELDRPLLDCALKCEAIMKTVYRSTSRTAYGMASNGTPVTVNIPGDPYSAQEWTGRYRFTFSHRKTSLEARGSNLSKVDDGQPRHDGSAENAQRHFDGPSIEVEIPDFPGQAGERLAKEWREGAAPMIESLRKRVKEDHLAKVRAEAQDAFLRDEKAARERWAFAKESAGRQLDDLRSKGAVGGEFLDMDYGQDGVVRWALAADREGRAAIMDQAERWSGSLAEARARATVEVAQRGGAGAADTLELVVELDDPEFERDRLAKRRFRIMRGCPRDKLLAWADRIQILAGQNPQPLEATS